ncbi:MAG: YtxH domain-containing protein [Gemmatimonadales bacterium]|nr:YtxH domain-containing protein [Gemmatimonadales bacterium]
MMEDEEVEIADDAVDAGVPVEARMSVGFAVGLTFGVLIGAGLALLFAPERGDKTRGRLRRRLRDLGDDAKSELGRAEAGARSVGKDLSRRGKRIRRQIEKASDRVRDAV